MIPVSRLVASMRYALREMQGTEISDFELIESINQAVALLYSRLCEKFVFTALKKTNIVTDENGEAVLPSDFLSVYRVGMGADGYAVPESYRADYEGSYRIMGDMFYAPAGIYSLEYYYQPQRVINLSDALDVPLAVSPYIEQIAVALFKHDLAGAEQIVQLCCNSLGGGEYSHFENTGPVQILGGKL